MAKTYARIMPMTSRWVRHFRSRAQGSFKHRLVSQEIMRDAISQLLANTERYIVLLKLPRTNWQTGKSQNTTLTLFESDGIDLTSAIDPRLLRARRVAIVLSDRQKGTARIDLSKRTWEVWQDSPTIREKLIEFNSKLILGKRGPFVTSGWAWSALLVPAWTWFIAFTIWSVADKKNRHYLSTNTPGQKAPPTPHWLHIFFSAALLSWPFWILVFLCITIIISMSGGLLIWPSSLTANSAAEAFYRLRTNLFTMVNMSMVIIGSITALLGALFTYFLTR
jgi:hypothetical protein